MYSPERKPSSCPLISLTITPSTSKTTNHLPTATSTPCWAQSLVSFRNSWTICSGKVLFGHPVLQEAHWSYFPRKKMAPFGSVSIFGTSTRLPKKIDTPYHWSQTSSANWVQLKSTPSLTCMPDTTKSTSPLVTNGKPRFGSNMAPLNFLLCQWDLLTCWPHFNTS